MSAGDNWACPAGRCYQASMISGTFRALQQWEAATKADIEEYRDFGRNPHSTPPPLAPRPVCAIRGGDIHKSMIIPVGEAVPAKQSEGGERLRAGRRERMDRLDWAGKTNGPQAQLEDNEQILRSLDFGFSSTEGGGGCAEEEPSASSKWSVDRASIVGDDDFGRVVTDRCVTTGRESAAAAAVETRPIYIHQPAQLESREAYRKWICCAEPSEEEDASQPGRAEAYQQLTAASGDVQRDASVTRPGEADSVWGCHQGRTVPASRGFDCDAVAYPPNRPASGSIVCIPKSLTPVDGISRAERCSSVRTTDSIDTPRSSHRRRANRFPERFVDPDEGVEGAGVVSHARELSRVGCTLPSIESRKVACQVVESNEPWEGHLDGREYTGERRTHYGRGHYRDSAASGAICGISAYQNLPNALPYYGQSCQPEAWWHGNGLNYGCRWAGHTPPASEPPPSGRSSININVACRLTFVGRNNPVMVAGFSPQ